MTLVQANILQTVCPALRRKYYMDACNSCIAPVAFAPWMWSFACSLSYKPRCRANTKDCTGNTEHYDINVNDWCNSK